MAKESPKNYSRTIGIFCGSRSAEHDQSITTAIEAAGSIHQMGFNVVIVYLDNEGYWHLAKINPQNLPTRKLFSDLQTKSKVINWSLEINRLGKMVFSAPKAFGKNTIEIDIAFPVFHGLAGEDGTFQGLCDLLLVPYVGCSLTTSAMALDKVLAKDVLRSFDIPCKPDLYFTQIEWRQHAKTLLAHIAKELSFPVYVKPARLGGSIGITKVVEAEDLVSAIESGFKFDNKVLVEEAVAEPLDIVVSVMGNSFAPEHVVVSQPQCRDSQTNEFQAVSMSQKDINAIKDLAKKTFSAFEATGISQIDIIKNTKTNNLFVTEIDTMPHDLSLPLWEASGQSAEVVLRELIRLADENFARSK